ncbi:hypothetical protein CC78DRAFT_536160 [Lojkania enalia]|uniref:Cell wall mannoprotein n=1 Tax=Lojkania enalia TaxID=147567 RepID=A0A9P4K266_9PLEO|nr:hypothetical protein CC78DRAFT_536160 [Didymosphaeria enalia]
MKQQILALAPLLLTAAVAHPTTKLYKVKREVPQEHSHQAVLDKVDEALNLNNPDGIVASVFGLLGAAAAAEGAGNIADADCLQQATADQAFTNAKEIGDIDLMTNALIFRALERNTGEVGLVSVPCESIQAVNPEIAALQQHQDPASDGAAELNKEITLELARQIASIGGNPLDALEASTFAPGEIGDPTAAGNTCNDENDPAGCINTLGLRVDDASEDEILAAVQDIDGAADAVDDADNADVADDAADDADVNASTGAISLGACSDVSIVFGTPSDGRNEDAFEAADLATFPHGSALNIRVISDFICTQLGNKCGASDAIVAGCQAASAAASELTGQAAADFFNNAASN